MSMSMNQFVQLSALAHTHTQTHTQLVWSRFLLRINEACTTEQQNATPLQHPSPHRLYYSSTYIERSSGASQHGSVELADSNCRFLHPPSPSPSHFFANFTIKKNCGNWLIAFGIVASQYSQTVTIYGTHPLVFALCEYNAQFFINNYGHQLT